MSICRYSHINQLTVLILQSSTRALLLFRLKLLFHFCHGLSLSIPWSSPQIKLTNGLPSTPQGAGSEFYPLMELRRDSGSVNLFWNQAWICCGWIKYSFPPELTKLILQELKRIWTGLLPLDMWWLWIVCLIIRRHDNIVIRQKCWLAPNNNKNNVFCFESERPSLLWSHESTSRCLDTLPRVCKATEN